MGIGITRWLAGAQPARRPEKRALDEAMERLSARLKQLEEPRPTRAEIAAEPDERSLDGTFEVPVRATVYPKFNRTLAGRMCALAVRRSRTGELLIARLVASMQSQAVVFDREGDVVWEPEGGVDLVFRSGEREVIEVGSIYQHDPAAHRVGAVEIVSPLQSEITWFVARHRWPSRELVFQSEIELPQGWVEEVVLSPDERRVCVVFVDQTEAGWLVVDIDDDENAIAHEPHFQRRTNLVRTPVWSPEGARVAGVATSDWEWWLPPGPESGADREAREAARNAWRARGAAGGRVRAGWLFVQDAVSDAVTERELFVDLPAGWGAELDTAAVPQIGPLRFVDPCTVDITMQDGSTQTITLV